jgi:hypothetical protein
MWTYKRQSQFVIMTFADAVSADDAYAAAARTRDDIGTTPMRVVIDVTGVDFPEKYVWIFLAVLEDAPIVDVILVGASRDTTDSFRLVGTSFAVRIATYATGMAWLASERAARRAPRAPTPLLALTA